MPDPHTDAIIAQIQCDVRAAMDQFIGKKIPNELEQESVLRIITHQMEELLPSRNGNQWYVNAVPDQENPSVMNIDVTFRHPLTRQFFKHTEHINDIEINGEVWTKFSITA